MNAAVKKERRFIIISRATSGERTPVHGFYALPKPRDRTSSRYRQTVQTGLTDLRLYLTELNMLGHQP